MISLTITIVVIVILAMIVIQTSSSLPSDATYAKFSEELTSVESAVETFRTKNAAQGDSEEKINAGFRKVKLRKAPGGFESFDRTGVDITGYVVDLDLIGYTNAQFGQGYDSEDGELEFLKDDVYVYDSTGTVYYVKGIEYKSEMIHTLLEGMSLGMTSTADGPIISNVTVTSGELADGTKTSGKAKIIISAFPRYDGELTVMVRNIIAEKLPNGTYVAQVSRNGIYTLAVTEKDGGRTVQKVNVTGIVEQNDVPSNLSIVVNNGEGFTRERLVEVLLRADGATKMIVTQDNPLKPASSDQRWKNFESAIEYDLGSVEKRITLYAWFKDDFANVTDQIVKATIVYDKTPPSSTKPLIVESGPYVIVTTNQKDNIATDAYIESKTEYGYRLYDGVGAYEDDYTWTTSKLVGPLDNKKVYEFVTRAEDEAGNKSMSNPERFTINYDYIINFDLQGGVGNVEPIYAAAGESLRIEKEAPTRLGYAFVGWSEKEDALPTDASDVITPEEEYTPTGSEIQKTLYAIWAPRTDIEYKVNHYVEKDGVMGEYELRLVETFTGTVGKLAYAIPLTTGDFFGFIENEFHSQRVGMAEIKGDGSTELSIYYYRGRFDLTVVGENAIVTGTAMEVPYEAEIDVIAVPSSGYEFDRWIIEGVAETSEDYNNFINENGKWNANAVFKMLGRDIKLIAKTQIEKFAITYELKGGLVAGINPVEYSRETPEFTLINPTKTGYAFAGWKGTDLIDTTINVTVNPATLVNIGDRNYEAIFVPTDDLLTITANPTTPTNTTVRAIIECLDPNLRLEYRVGSEGTWDVYVTSVPINENTTVYARVLENGVIIDEEALVINNIDTVAPIIKEVSVSEKWEPGNDLLIKVEAEDNVEIHGYAVTTSNVEPSVDSYESTNDELKLREGLNYIWVRDTAGNAVSTSVNAWEVSDNGTRTAYAFLKDEKELNIVGEGKTKSYEEDTVPYDFFKDKIDVIKIEEGIEEIGEYLLASMPKVTHIHIPSTLEKITENGMIYTNKFENIEIAEGNRYFVFENYALLDKNKTTIYVHSAADPKTYYDVPATVELINRYAFYDNDKINKIVTTSNPEIGESAFEDCEELYEIVGEIGGEAIGARAFAECQNLHIIDLSETLKHIGEATFANTVRLSVIEMSKTLEELVDADATQKGVFANIGIYNEGDYPKGVVRYYQSTAVVHKYATKYSTEAIFEMIDDIAPTFIKLEISSPETGAYAREEEITFVATFDETLGVIDSTRIPKLTIKIGDGEVKEVTTAVIEGNEIRYTYIVEAEDLGKINLVDYVGTVVDLAGNEADIRATSLGGNEITVNTAIELIEDGNVFYFAVLQKAINKARTDGEGTTTIRLLKDISESVDVAANKNIFLDLNQRVLTTAEAKPIITNRGKLEINSTGTITSERELIKSVGNSTTTIKLVRLDSTGTNITAIIDEAESTTILSDLELTSQGTCMDINGTIHLDTVKMSTETGPAIVLRGGSEATIEESEIESNLGYSINITAGAEAEIIGGRVVTTDGTAINNNGKAKLSGGAHVEGPFGITTTSSLEIENANVVGNTENGYGIRNTGNTKMLGGTVSSVTNGAVLNELGTFEMSGGRIESTAELKDAVKNSAGARFIVNGGEVYSETGLAVLNLGTLEVTDEGVVASRGAMTINNRAELNVTGGRIEGVSSTDFGTVIQNTGTATFNGGTVESNSNNGILNTGSGRLSIRNITMNIAGGVNEVVGITLESKVLTTIEDSIINVTGNLSGARGIYVAQGASLEIDSSTMNVLTVEKMAYGIYNEGGTVTVGVLDNVMSETSPVLEGMDYGYYSQVGTLNYYDGNFKGKEGMSIEGEITRTPDKAYAAYIIEEDRETSVLKIDVDKPTNVKLIISTEDWTNQTIIMSGEATDEGSGIKEYAITNSANPPAAEEWIELVDPQNEFIIVEEKTDCKTYYLHVKDQTGNTAVSNSVETKYDNIPPKIDSLDYAPRGWTSGDVMVTFVASDEISGIEGYEFSKTYHEPQAPGNGYIVIDPALTVSKSYKMENGTVHVYVYDQAGNFAYDSIDISNVDKINPNITVEFVQYFEEYVRVKVTGTDAESGVNVITMNGIVQSTTAIDGGREAICLIQKEGTTVFEVIDMVGNKTTAEYKTYTITYEPNGGTGMAKKELKVDDHSRIIRENDYTKDMFMFVNWNTKNDGTGTVYNPGDEYTGNEALTLYAQWKDIEAPVVLDVELSPEWELGEEITLRIYATDNVGVTKYAITTTDTEPTIWMDTPDVPITLGNVKYYIWASDDAGNTSYMEVKVYDLSTTESPNSVIGIQQAKGKDAYGGDTYILTIEGTGVAKDLTEATCPWKSEATSIIEVIVKEGITRLGEKLLANLPSANRITIGSTVTDIAIDAFMHTTNFTVMAIEGENFFMDLGGLYNSSGDTLYVSSSKTAPEFITALTTLRYMAPYAYENTPAKQIIIAENIDLPEGAFYNAKNLEEIVAENQIGGTSIGAKAFEGASKLEHLDLSETLQVIGDRAFYGTNELTGLEINKTLTQINGTSVFVNIGTNAGTDTGKGYVYYYESCAPMHQYATNAVTKDQATFIGIDDIPPVVSEVVINDGATITNSRGVNLNITATDNHIVDRMFITESPDIDPRLMEVEWLEFDAECEYALSPETEMKTVYVWVMDDSGNVSESCASASIKYVEYEFKLNGDTEMVQYVDTTGKDYYEYREPGYFIDDESLDVTISGNVKHDEIRKYNVEYLISLEGEEIETIVRTVDVIANSWNTEINVAGDYRFVTHTSGKYAKIVGYTPSSNEEILQIPEKFDVNGEVYEVIDIGNGTKSIVATNSTVIGIELPESVISVSSNAFSGFIELADVKYSDNLMTIGSYAFANSNSTYGEVVIKDNVREVKEGAFNNSIINKIVIEEGVRAIYENAFYSRNNTSENETLEIPASVDYIGIKAFYGYRANEIVVNEGNLKYASVDNKSLVSKDGTVLYQYALGNAATTFDVPSSVTEIADGAVAESIVLTEVTLGDSVTKIGNEAFKSSAFIQHINNTGNLEEIGESAFENTALVDFELSEKITEIKAKTFKNSEIANLVIPETITTIGSGAYSNIYPLAYVIFEGVPTIAGDAFTGNTSLTEIIALDLDTVIGATSVVQLENLTDVFVLTPEMEAKYENDANWSGLGAERIKVVAALEGEAEIELVDGEPYIEDGVTLLDEFFATSGQSSYIEAFEVEFITNENWELVGEYTLKYLIKFNSETVFELTRLVRVIDTIPPVITSIETAPSWVPGTQLQIKVTATDERTGSLKYAATDNANGDGASWNTSDIVTVTENTKFINVADGGMNVTSKEITVWDISKNNDAKVFAYLRDGSELVITGEGPTKDMSERGNVLWKDYIENITKVTIEDGVTHLGEYILSGLDNVSEITIPDTISNSANVATNAFAGTNNFVIINLSDENTAFNLSDQYTLVSENGERIYMHSRRDESSNITIDSTVKYISDSAFYMNNMLESIEFVSPVDIEKLAFESSLNLSMVTGEIGNTYLEDGIFSGDINLCDITISDTVEDLGVGLFTKVTGPVYYYASNDAMVQYAADYPDETIYIVIDNTGPTDTAPTLSASSATIKATSNQSDTYSAIIETMYLIRKDGEEYNEDNWQVTNYFYGLDANTKYFVITRSTDANDNTTVSEETSIITEKVPEQIEITADSTPTSGDVVVTIVWPTDEINRLYGNEWEEHTSVTKQVGILNKGDTSISWFDVKDAAGSYNYTITENGTTVFARLFDGFNYTETIDPISLTIDNIDREKPTGSVIINNNDEEVYVHTITLALSATDNRSGGLHGVKTYFVSENPTPDFNTGTWYTYTDGATHTYTLSGTTALKTLYVWYKDAAGNISNVASDSIMLVTGVARLEENSVKTYYDTLTDAIAAAATSPSTASKITLLKNISEEPTINVAVTKNILLDMNGFDISKTSTTNVTTISNAGTLRIINSKVSDPVTIYSVTTSGTATGIYNTGLLEITDVSVSASSPSGQATGIHNQNNN